MPNRYVTVFPTLVLLLTVLLTNVALAAKSKTLNTLEDTEENQTQVPIDSSRRADTVDIKIPPEQRIPSLEKEFFFPYRRALAARIGSSMRTAAIREGTQPTIMGIQFFFKTLPLVEYETGADLFSDGTGALHLARRWTFSRGKTRPFAKAGGALIVNPKDQLASFAKYDLYLAEGAAGVEHLIYRSQSLRAEFEGGLGLKTLQFSLSIGYSWAW